MIHHLLHRIWVGGEEPEWTRGFAASWERPGWVVWNWNDSNVESLFPLRNQEIYDAAPEIAPNHVGQLHSDLLRYEILHRFGGIYVDTDFECLRPIDVLIGCATYFAAWEVQGKWIANGLMGATPAHWFIDRLITELPASVERFRGHKPNKLTGPQFLTRMWREYGTAMTILPQGAIYPYGFAEIEEHGPGEEWPDAWAVHHWQNKRRERGIPA